MWQVTLTETTADLEGIRALQQQNLRDRIDDTEKQSQGFVTMQYDPPLLQQMHKRAPSVIIKDEGKIIAYALTMLRECRGEVPDLEPMFALFDSLHWQNKPLKDYRFYVMGQVCVSKAYRGQGLFEALYQHHKKVYSSRFDLFITEIAERNGRSLRAHEKVGFKTIHTYRDSLDDWRVVAWDWK